MIAVSLPGAGGRLPEVRAARRRSYSPAERLAQSRWLKTKALTDVSGSIIPSIARKLISSERVAFPRDRMADVGITAECSMGSMCKFPRCAEWAHCVQNGLQVAAA